MKLTHLIATALAAALCFGTAQAQDKTPDQLAAESVAKTQATAATKTTPTLIKQTVDAAAALVSKEGPASFDKFKGSESSCTPGPISGFTPSRTARW
jgi:hypothetical protein